MLNYQFGDNRLSLLSALELFLLLLLALLLHKDTVAGHFNELGEGGATPSFEHFKQKYSKLYKSAQEENIRQKIYTQNVQLIEKHNRQQRLGVESYTLAVNEYADWTPKEFQSYMNGNDEQDFDTWRYQRMAILKTSDYAELPTHMDWREFGAVTPVKKQMKCGSCWAFSATGALEGQHFLQTGRLVSLSEQNLLDCTTTYHNMGCHGGSKERAFLYVRDNNGIDTERSYPYAAQQHGECLFNASTVGATCGGFVGIAAGDEHSMTAAVAKLGPVAVSLNGKCLKLQFYKEGIFNDEGCNSKQLTHAVLIVGYARNASTQEPYWIVKNSWGADWGMNGYVLVPRFSNFAGIAMRASIPSI